MENIVVIKCGGSTLSSLNDSFFKNIKELIEIGKKPVIVHGGGPEIKKMLTKLNVPTEFIHGLRKTTEEVMEVVEMVLSGKVNKQLVSKLNEQNITSVGVSGIDGGLLQASPRNLEELGFVGDVTKVDTNFLRQLIEQGYVPVIAPIGFGSKGERYNINADSAAGAVAREIEAEQLLFVTDVPGILKDGVLLEDVTIAEIKELIENGTIYGGMIPKVEAAMHSLEGNLNEVMIVDGESANMIQNGKIIGTTIRTR